MLPGAGAALLPAVASAPASTSAHSQEPVPQRVGWCQCSWLLSFQCWWRAEGSLFFGSPISVALIKYVITMFSPHQLPKLPYFPSLERLPYSLTKCLLTLQGLIQSQNPKKPFLPAHPRHTPHQPLHLALPTPTLCCRLGRLEHQMVPGTSLTAGGGVPFSGLTCFYYSAT